MAFNNINIGNSANDGNGDPLRTSWDKTNRNFRALFMIQEDGSPVIAPSSSTGEEGDYAGKMTYDENFLYVCVQDYDPDSSTTEIWRRIDLSTGGTW